MRDNAVTVKTPEGVTFSLPLAGPTVRGFAAILDGFIVSASIAAIVSSLSVIALISSDLLGFLAILAQFIISAGYGIACEWFLSGQTFGKKIFGIRVMDSRGLPLRFYQVLIRNIVRPLDQLPLFYLVGGISCLVSRSFQRLGDHAAGTIVIVSRRAAPEDLSALPRPKYNTLMTVPHIVSRLRQNIPAQLAALAVEALGRAGTLDPQARIAVFAALCAAFKRRCELPPEYIEGIPDESLVANIVQVLYSDRHRLADGANKQGRS